MSRKKIRPNPGDPIEDGMSERDVTALGIISRRQIQTAKAIACIPKETFERLVESDSPPTVTQLAAIGKWKHPARRRAKCCPHCGGMLQ